MEEANPRGVDGRKVELLIHDDEQQAAAAIKATEALVAARIEAIVGPMTSSMGEAILPAATSRRAGGGQSDHHLVLAGRQGRPVSRWRPRLAPVPTSSAALEYTPGIRRVAIVYDLSNRTYSADWAEETSGGDFTALGGAIVAEASFMSGDDASYTARANQENCRRETGFAAPCRQRRRYGAPDAACA